MTKTRDILIWAHHEGHGVHDGKTLMDRGIRLIGLSVQRLFVAKALVGRMQSHIHGCAPVHRSFEYRVEMRRLHHG